MKVLLIVYDNGSYIHWFPSGTAYIAAALEDALHDVTIWSQDYYHYDDSEITGYIDNNNFDVVALGIIAGYYQYKKLLALSKHINAAKKKPVFILAGQMVTPDPMYFLGITGADFIVMGEGEETIVDLLNNLDSPEGVKGIAYKGGINEARPLMDVDSIPFPAFHLFPIEYYRLMRFVDTRPGEFVMPVVSSRGCKFNCNFCYRMMPGYRKRSWENVQDEIEFLQDEYRINYIYFHDELFMDGVESTIKYCESIIKSGLKFRWGCNGRLNYANPEVVKAMKAAGCVFVNYGIESYDDETLKKMNKALTVNMISEGIKNTVNAGIHPGFNIIYGNIDESADALKAGVEFLLENTTHAQMRTIRPVTPYPGSPLFYTAIEMGLLKDTEDFYAKHVNSDLMTCNFTGRPDDEVYSDLAYVNKLLLDDYVDNKKTENNAVIHDLYVNKNAEFRGFRQT